MENTFNVTRQAFAKRIVYSKMVVCVPISENPQYADIKCFELNATEIEYLQSLSESIINNVEVIDDEVAVSVERHSGSSSSNLLPDSDTIDNGRNALDFVRITNSFHKVPENTNAN